MHKKVFGDWAPPRPAGGAYSAPPDNIAGFKGGALWQVNTGKGGQGMDKGGWGEEGSSPHHQLLDPPLTTTEAV